MVPRCARENRHVLDSRTVPASIHQQVTSAVLIDANPGIHHWLSEPRFLKVTFCETFSIWLTTTCRSKNSLPYRLPKKYPATLDIKAIRYSLHNEVCILGCLSGSKGRNLQPLLPGVLGAETREYLQKLAYTCMIKVNHW